jgi:hypothetical protein
MRLEDTVTNVPHLSALPYRLDIFFCINIPGKLYLTGGQRERYLVDVTADFDK